MTIDGDTIVAKLLDEHPELLDAFVSVSPHFKKLENKFLRKTIARRVTISDAAKVGGVDLDQLILALNAKIEPGSGSDPGSCESDVDWSDDYGEDFDCTDTDIQLTLDVRDDIASNRDPLGRIMRGAKDIKAGKILVVINSFEPVPLYEVLGKKGFVHKTEIEHDIVRVFFKRVTQGQMLRGQTLSRFETLTGLASGSSVSGDDTDGDEKVMEIDVRGLEPPEPMMKILKTIGTMDDNAILLVHHHREPLFLYDKLEERGFEAIANKVEQNHYKIVIRRKGAK